MNHSVSESKKSCQASFSSSFEVYAAIGGDPDTDQVDDLFIAASKAVLNIENEDNQTRRRTSRRRSSITKTETHISTRVRVIDCDKMGVYFGSEDGIVCFSIAVTILVRSSDLDLNRVSATAETLATAAELAVTNGEFSEALNNVEGPISVLLMEMAPESSSSDSFDYDDYDEYDEYNDYAFSRIEDEKDDGASSSIEGEKDDGSSSSIEGEKDDGSSSSIEGEKDDGSSSGGTALSSGADEEDFFTPSSDADQDYDDDDLSSMGSTEFDDFLEISYREYLQDQNRQEILARINTPTSPSTVSDFPSEYSETCPDFPPPYTKQKPRSEPKVKFDPVVRVKNTMSRNDMTPNERFNYWSSADDEIMSHEEREKLLKKLTDRWALQKEKESRIQTEEDLDASSDSLLMPVLPAIKQLLPAAEREGHDGYTYTISIRG